MKRGVLNPLFVCLFTTVICFPKGIRHDPGSSIAARSLGTPSFVGKPLSRCRRQIYPRCSSVGYFLLRFFFVMYAFPESMTVFNIDYFATDTCLDGHTYSTQHFLLPPPAARPPRHVISAYARPTTPEGCRGGVYVTGGDGRGADPSERRRGSPGCCMHHRGKL